MKQLLFALLLGAGVAQAQTVPDAPARLRAARVADRAENYPAAAALYGDYLKTVPTDTTAAKDYAYVLLQCLERQPQPMPVDYYPLAVASCDKLIAQGQPRYYYFRALAAALRARTLHDATFAPLVDKAGQDLVAYDKQHGPDDDSRQLRQLLARMGWKP